jgi:hypothetical protein
MSYEPDLAADLATAQAELLAVQNAVAEDSPSLLAVASFAASVGPPSPPLTRTEEMRLFTLIEGAKAVARLQADIDAGLTTVEIAEATLSPSELIQWKYRHGWFYDSSGGTWQPPNAVSTGEGYIYT